MISFLRLCLWPFSLIYGFVIVIRNLLYDLNILKSTKFSQPVIVIGNLSVGGAGKSPLTEYLIQLLQKSYKVATLSRGYGRKTRGFRIVDVADSVEDVGDEPLQFKTKFPLVTVAVCEDRVKGVSALQASNDVLILDDAYQHRALTPGLSILLLEYSSLLKPRLLLPAGNFRDSFKERRRADIIIISKVPLTLSVAERKRIYQLVKPRHHQHLFFSFLKYRLPYKAFDYPYGIDAVPTYQTGVLMVSGIANPWPLLSYVADNFQTVESVSFPDHHAYSLDDVHSIINRFKGISIGQKIILTTEKDFQRLKGYRNSFALENIDVWLLPVVTSFEDDEQAKFESIIKSYCMRNVENKIMNRSNNCE